MGVFSFFKETPQHLHKPTLETTHVNICVRNKEKRTPNAENTLFLNRQESTPQENTESRKGKLNK